MRDPWLNPNPYGLLQDSMARITLLSQPSWQKAMSAKPVPRELTLLERINARVKQAPWTA